MDAQSNAAKDKDREANVLVERGVTIRLHTGLQQTEEVAGVSIHKILWLESTREAEHPLAHIRT